MERTRLGDARDPVKSFVGAASDRLRISIPGVRLARKTGRGH